MTIFAKSRRGGGISLSKGLTIGVAALAAIATMAVGMTAGVRPAHAVTNETYVILDPNGGKWTQIYPYDVEKITNGSVPLEYPLYYFGNPSSPGLIANNTLSPKAIKSGYKFIGLNTEKDGSGEKLTTDGRGQWYCDSRYPKTDSAYAHDPLDPLGCIQGSYSASNYVQLNRDSKKVFVPTLYAQWAPTSSYTVTYDPNGGTLAASSKATVTPGKALGSTPTPTWAGHTFDGWNTSKTGHGQWVDSSFKPTGSTTVYAQWETGSTPVAAQGNLTIKYDANGGNGAPAATTDKKPQGTRIGTPISTLTPSWAGHIFTGWNTQANGKGTEVSLGGSYAWTPSATPQTVTLYAQWQQVSHVENLPSAGGDLWISLAIVLVALAGGAAIAIGRKKKALAK